jgi:hypothetical protein
VEGNRCIFFYFYLLIVILYYNQQKLNYIIKTYIGHFITVSVFTNIHNKKNQRTYLNGIVHRYRNIEFFFDNYRCSMYAPPVTRHTSIRYSSSCHTRVNMVASIFFTAAMIRDFRSARSRGNVTLRILHEMHGCTVTTHLTLVIFQHTKRLLPPRAAIFSLQTLASPSGRNVNYYEKTTYWGKRNWVVLSVWTGFVNTCPTVFL